MAYSNELPGVWTVDFLVFVEMFEITRPEKIMGLVSNPKQYGALI